MTHSNSLPRGDRDDEDVKTCAVCFRRTADHRTVKVTAPDGEIDSEFTLCAVCWTRAKMLLR